MAYNDNYPNGYKSGYNSWDDPDRKDYSPSGWDRSQRSAMAASEERERSMAEYNSGIERERKRQQRLQEQRDMDEDRRIRERQQMDEHIKMYTKSISHLCEQKRNDYKKRSFLSRAVATISGKGFYKIPFWDLAKAEVDKMSNEQLEDFYRKNVR